MARDEKYRVLLVATHPVQYSSPIFRRMARHPRLDIQVAYCSLQGAEAGVDPEFGVEVAWDVPLLDGYPWVQVPNRSLRPGLGRFFGLVNPGLWKLIRTGGFDAVVSYVGYNHASFWILAAAAKRHRKPLLFGTDATGLAPRDGQRWKAMLKRRIWPRFFRLADVVIVPSTRSASLMQSLGIPADRIALTPFVVDNDWWSEQAARVDRGVVRQSWSVPREAPVVLFCGKLQPWKRPFDLLQAFARAGVDAAHLVYAGEGLLRAGLEEAAQALGVAERVHFLGFANQSRLPAIYRASDLLVLPSGHEPFGLVVNEAMLCGRAVVASDRVGAGKDLVREGETGFVYPCGDVDALARILAEVLPDRARINALSRAALGRMETWTPEQNIEGLVRAVEAAVQSRNRSDTRKQ